MCYAAHILAEMQGSYIYRGQAQPKSFWGPGKNLIGAVNLGKSYVSNQAGCGNKNSIYKAKNGNTYRYML